MISLLLGVVVPKHLWTEIHVTLLLSFYFSFMLHLGYSIFFFKLMREGGYISHTFHFKIIKKELHDICTKIRL